MLAFVTPTARCTDIAVMLAPFLVATSPSTRHHAVPLCRVEVVLSIAIHRRPSPSITTPSITAKSPSCHPYPSITIAIAVHRRCARAVPHRTLPSKSCHTIHCRQGAVAVAPHRPSPSRSRPSLSIRLLLSSRRRSVHCCPSLLSCRCAVHCHRAAPSITVKSPSRRPLPSIAVAITVHQHCAHTIPRRPSPPISRRAFHHCQVAIAPSIAVHGCPSPL